jgi:4-amino-4-deoxy-L-arabinose transferase-like glycosyltransferase
MHSLDSLSRDGRRLLWNPVVLIVGLLLLFGALHLNWHSGRTHPDENYHFKILLESLDHSLLTPTLDGKPWFTKPPLLLWLAAALDWGLGVGPRAALRLVSLAGWACSFMFVRKWLLLVHPDPHEATTHALAAVSGLGVLWFSRIGMMDLPLLANLLAVIWAAWSWKASGFTRRGVGALALALALGGWWKGPVFYVLAALPILAAWGRDNLRAGLTASLRFWPIVLISLLVGNAWLLVNVIRYGEEYTRFFFLHENLSRLKALRPGVLGAYFFLGISPFWPAVLAGLFLLKRSALQNPPVRVALALIASTLLVFGYGADKHFHWFIPAFVGLGMLAACLGTNLKDVRLNRLLAGFEFLVGVLPVWLGFVGLISFARIAEVELGGGSVLAMLWVLGCWTAGVLLRRRELSTLGWIFSFSILIHQLVPTAIELSDVPASLRQGREWSCAVVREGAVQESVADAILFKKFRGGLTDIRKEMTRVRLEKNRASLEALALKLTRTIHCVPKVSG